jgi:hypothetical protein
MADPKQDTATVRYSQAVRVKRVVDLPFPMAVDYTYNAFWRDAYNKAAEGIAEQARALLERGNVSMEEARQLVEVQRNGLVAELRKPLSPFGKLYSEILKPAKSLPTLEQLIERKGTIELVLESAGKTRTTVNRIAFVAKRVGIAGIALEVVLTVVVIELAPADQRGAVASRQIGGVVGAVSFGSAGGWAGAWAGATAFTIAGSPTLVIPIVGEVTEGGCAIIGGVIGFFAFGWLGQKTGERAGSNMWLLLRAYWY